MSKSFDKIFTDTKYLSNTVKIDTDPAEPVIEYRLVQDILENDVNYFFTLMDLRFHLIEGYLGKFLQKVYGKRFEPIHILSNRIVNLPEMRNYILINSRIKSLVSNIDHNIVIVPEHEELNEDFSNSRFIKKLLSKLLKKQDHVFINAFTTSFMKVEEGRIMFLGPKPSIAKYFDSKVNQREFLERHDLPTPSGQVFTNFEDMESSFKKGVVGNSFIYSEYGSGGAEVAEIKSTLDLREFKNRIRPRNLNNPFIVTDILPKSTSPNSTAIVLGDDEVFVVSITDQILKGYKYLGNIYPSKVSLPIKKKLIEYTREVGLRLAKEGYRGFFGCDFVITPTSDCYIVDLNPRKQGGFLCNFLMFEKIKSKNLPNLVELEATAVLGQEIEEDLSSWENPQINFHWAQCKIYPKAKNKKIIKEIREYSEESCFSDVGSYFIKSFYPKNSIFVEGSMLGLILMTGKVYDDILTKLLFKAEENSKILMENQW